MKIFKQVYSPLQVNTYILTDESGDCTLLDCGCYDDNEFSQLVKFIDSKMLKPVLLLNTHCHIDHIFGNKYILDKYNLRPYCCEDDEMNRKNAVEHASYFGLLMENPPEPAGYISDGQIITFGSTRLIALHVPGHTTGSIAFYSESDGCVFTGDALFAGSIGRTNLQGGDFKTLINSIKNKLLVLPPSTVVFSGHGPDTTIEKEMKSNPWLK